MPGYTEFMDDLRALIQDDPELIRATMSNVLSMRQIGNKTHGDIAEVALAELVASFLEGYGALHVGKDRFRAKAQEEDVLIRMPSGEEIVLSLKAYGNEYLQLSTDKEFKMFPYLQDTVGEQTLTERSEFGEILSSDIFRGAMEMNVLPFIYNEKHMQFNIMVFDTEKAFDAVRKVEYVAPGGGNRRKYPIYRFVGPDDDYIFEVRYGGQDANALQRGMWTHTRHAESYFDSLTGWMEYEINQPLLDLLSKLLVSKQETHKSILDTYFSNTPNSG